MSSFRRLLVHPCSSARSARVGRVRSSSSHRIVGRADRDAVPGAAEPRQVHPVARHQRARPVFRRRAAGRRRLFRVLRNYPQAQVKAALQACRHYLAPGVPAVQPDPRSAERSSSSSSSSSPSACARTGSTSPTRRSTGTALRVPPRVQLDRPQQPRVPVREHGVPEPQAAVRAGSAVAAVPAAERVPAAEHQAPGRPVLETPARLAGAWRRGRGRAGLAAVTGLIVGATACPARARAPASPRSLGPRPCSAATWLRPTPNQGRSATPTRRPSTTASPARSRGCQPWAS